MSKNQFVRTQIYYENLVGSEMIGSEMKKYYQIFYNDDVSGFGKSLEDDLFFLPKNGIIKEWSSIKLELIDGGFSDYLASSLGCRLCSKKLKSLFQENAGIDDNIQWLDVDVKKGNEVQQYYILHFPSPPNNLCQEDSIFAGEFVVKPVLKSSLIENCHVFAYPNAGSLKLFVSEQLKELIKSENITGLELELAAVR